MELKKNPQADLSKKSGLFLSIGLVVSLLVVITAFEWKFYDELVLEWNAKNQTKKPLSAFLKFILDRVSLEFTKS